MSDDFYRIKRLPPYVIAEVNAMRAQARSGGEDIIDPANATSLRLAARAGFVQQEDVGHRDGSTTLHLREIARR